MKSLMIMAVAAISLTACNSNSNTTSESNDKKVSDPSNQTTTANPTSSNSSSLSGLLSSYLQIKNALAEDNAQEAATGGNAFVDAIGKIDQSSMTPEQKKSFNDLADDAKEMAEHIGKNADKFEHQREHFEMLSNDVYDMVKTFKSDKTLYKDFCPMYNNNKGANWISETKEIKNPYLGKKMPTCGEIKEEIKQLKTRTKIVVGLRVAFIAIQFIHPVRNKSSQVLPVDFFNIYHAPGAVEALIKQSCYDCHSNNTNYPWYANVQPFGWFLSNHIKKGKAQINFSEFGSYPKRRQISKLKNIQGSIQDGSMPLSSYTLIHTKARLTDENRKTINEWLEKLRDSLSNSSVY